MTPTRLSREQAMEMCKRLKSLAPDQQGSKLAMAMIDMVIQSLSAPVEGHTQAAQLQDEVFLQALEEQFYKIKKLLTSMGLHKSGMHRGPRDFCPLCLAEDAEAWIKNIKLPSSPKSAPVEAGMPKRPRESEFDYCREHKQVTKDMADYATALESHATQQAAQLAELKNKLAGYEGTTHHANCGCEEAEKKLVVAKEALELNQLFLSKLEYPRSKNWVLKRAKLLVLNEKALTTLQGVV